jgi:hypothetical protein
MCPLPSQASTWLLAHKLQESAARKRLELRAELRSDSAKTACFLKVDKTGVQVKIGTGRLAAVLMP